MEITIKFEIGDEVWYVDQVNDTSMHRCPDCGAIHKKAGQIRNVSFVPMKA